jgi:RNase P subunit RPR2
MFIYRGGWMMLIKKLACPRCKSTLFESYYVQVEGFHPDGTPLVFIMHKCARCGWETHPRNIRDLRKYLDAVMRGEKVEGFVFAEG